MNIVLALIGAFSILIGTQQQGDLIRFPVDVESATLITMEDGTPAVHVIGTETLTCDMPMMIDQQYDDGVLTIDIYEEATAAISCLAGVVPYNEVIPLNISSDTVLTSVVVNGIEATAEATTPDMPAETPSIPANGITSPQIDEVTITQVNGQLELTVSGTEFFNCGFDLVQMQEVFQVDWLRVEIYREIPPNVRCAGEEQPFTMTIPVDPAYNPDPTLPTLVARTFVVEVNNYIGQLNFVPDEAGGFTPELIPTTRELFFIDSAVATVNEDGTVSLSISAQPPDGCMQPYIVHQSPADPFTVEVYRPALLDVRACPLILRTYNIDYTLDLPADLEDGVYTVQVNDTAVTFNIGESTMDSTPSDNQVLTVVENVEVLILESFPPQLQITVTGYHPDGCRYPVQTETSIDGTDITVRIFRAVPADVVCTMNVVPYEDTLNLGAVDPATYTLHVNDFTTEVRVD